MANGFVKAQRSPELMDLLFNDAPAYHLASVIAFRADRETGEARIGDWRTMGMTSRGAMRNALNRLIRANLVTINSTKAGTLAKLVDTRLFDINQKAPSHQPSHQSSQQAPKTQAISQATNKKYKEVFIKELEERGAAPEHISAWLKFRTEKKNTESALAAQLKNLDALIAQGHSAARMVQVVAEKPWVGIVNKPYFIEAITENRDVREQLTDTSWAGGNQRDFQNAEPDLPRLPARQV